MGYTLADCPVCWDHFIQEAVEAASVDVGTFDVVKDFVESLSIIQQDGGHFEFAHRSFQEYFFAKFVVTDRDYTLTEKLSELGSIWVFDDTVGMISEMNHSYYCDEFLLPEARKLKVFMDKVDVDKRPSSILTKLFDSVKLSLNEEGDEIVSYSTVVSNSNKSRSWSNLLWREAIKRPSIKAKLSSDKAEDELGEEVLAELRSRGSVPVHHMNDGLLIQLGCVSFAKNIRRSVSLLVSELEAGKKSRQSRLVNRMRSRNT